MEDIRDKMVSALKKLHLYEPMKKIIKGRLRRETNKRVKSILNEEAAYALDCYDSIDSIVGSLKISVHGIEKSLVKSNRNFLNLETQCTRLIGKVQDLVYQYHYPVASDIVREVIGISDLLILECGDSYGCETLKKQLADFQTKFHVSIPEGHVIRIQNKCASELDFIDADEYQSFVKSRHSIREMKNDVVPYEEIKEIVEIAQICPSACNRQSTKAYYTSDSEKIRKLFPDPAVTKDIYNILIVTVNKSYYSTNEALQAWIDGGIFLESMVMAMHSHRLGTCLFQCLKNTKRYYQVKEAVGIPENEDIVAFIGYGRLKDEYKVISTHRKEVDEVLVDFTNGGGNNPLAENITECAA